MRPRHQSERRLVPNFNVVEMATRNARGVSSISERLHTSISLLVRAEVDCSQSGKVHLRPRVSANDLCALFSGSQICLTKHPHFVDFIRLICKRYEYWADST